MTLANAIAAALGGNQTTQATCLGLHRVQWSRYVRGATAPLATAIDAWSAVLAASGHVLTLTYGPDGWAAVVDRGRPASIERATGVG